MSAPSLDHLRTLVTVYRAGSFSEAASLLGISQPTVTAHIRALEEGMGFPIFDRGVTGVTATAKGRELAESAEAHVDALDDLLAPVVAGSVHLGGAAEFVTAKVMPRLASLLQVTGAPIIVTLGLADAHLADLRDGRLDLVISSVPPRGPGVESVPFFDEEFALVAAPRWSSTPVEDVPLIAYAPGLPIIRRYWRSVFGAQPGGLAVAAIVPDLRGIVTALCDGAGMSVLPDYLIRDALADGSLVCLHEPEVAPLNTLYVVTRAGEPSGAVRALASAIAQIR